MIDARACSQIRLMLRFLFLDSAKMLGDRVTLTVISLFSSGSYTCTLCRITRVILFIHGYSFFSRMSFARVEKVR
jgi:hypothetical protein